MLTLLRRITDFYFCLRWSGCVWIGNFQLIGGRLVRDQSWFTFSKPITSYCVTWLFSWSAWFIKSDWWLVEVVDECSFAKQFEIFCEFACRRRNGAVKLRICLVIPRQNESRLEDICLNLWLNVDTKKNGGRCKFTVRHFSICWKNIWLHGEEWMQMKIQS